MRSTLGALLLVVAACEPELPPEMRRATAPSCATNVAPKPRAFVGPDVTLRLPCAGTERVPVASVSDQGSGFTDWNVAVEGDPSFQLLQSDFHSCGAQGASVAFVDFTPPPDALPGDAFDAVATVRAVDDAFPTGTVALHGEVVPWDATPEKTAVEFGDVEVRTLVGQTLTFRLGSLGIDITPPHAEPPFQIRMESRQSPTLATYTITVLETTPGDYTMNAEWTAGADPMARLPLACVWRRTIPLHVRIVERSDGGADAPEDAGVEAPP